MSVSDSLRSLRSSPRRPGTQSFHQRVWRWVPACAGTNGWSSNAAVIEQASLLPGRLLDRVLDLRLERNLHALADVLWGIEHAKNDLLQPVARHRVDLQILLLGGCDELRVLEGFRERRAQRRDALGGHARRGGERAADG